eukprot:11236209-Alexandrium_andersonii.AAC.1
MLSATDSILGESVLTLFSIFLSSVSWDTLEPNAVRSQITLKPGLRQQETTERIPTEAMNRGPRLQFEGCHKRIPV